MDLSNADECSSSPMSKLNSSSTSSEQSLNGLKFGQKVYFEDVGAAAQAKAGDGFSTSASNSTPTKKAKVGVLQGARPPRCLVEGCEEDLSDAKPYYSRHKVCAKHSKWPTVIVAGLEQRFCQQCSRFHQLSEFDQGKRSCRRRLAGHNERRRKPPSGSLSNYRYENHGGIGGLLVDFTAYPKLTAKDVWPSSRSPEQEFGNQTCAAPAKPLPLSWQSNFRSPPSDLFLQGSRVGMIFPNHGMPPGECFTGVTDTTCALSLLSNQQWASTNPTLITNGVNSLVNFEGAPITQLTTTPSPHGAATHQIPSTLWGFKVTESGSSSHENFTDIGLAPMSPNFGIQRYDESELSRPSTRQHMEIEHLRAYQSPQQMHWSP